MPGLLPAFQRGGFEGQQAVLPFLSHSLEHGQISHAYLFKGPVELGLKLALALAQGLFCPQRGCGQCHVCQAVQQENYPDLHLLRAEGEGQRAPIKLKQIHHLVEQVALPPMQSSHQVFILLHAENMNKESSNALLKTLEEPPSNSVMILLTPFLERVLPTIRSRTQILSLHAAIPDSDFFRAQASAPDEFWSWQDLEAIRSPQALPRLLEHLETLSSTDLELQLLLLQRECWQRIQPFIVSKASQRGLQRARRYLELFENALAQLRTHAHSKMLIETFGHRYLQIRQEV